MNTSSTAPRPTIAWIPIGVLAAMFGGCLATSMTARYARVPVMVGPVPCIGCQAGAPPEGPADTPIIDGAVRSSGFMVLPVFGEVDYFAEQPPLIDFKAEAALPDPCKGEIRITRLKAESFGVFALLYANSEEKIDVSGSTFFVPRGSCGPRLWPYAGPQGIVVFDPPGSKGGAP